MPPNERKRSLIPRRPTPSDPVQSFLVDYPRRVPSAPLFLSPPRMDPASLGWFANRVRSIDANVLHLLEVADLFKNNIACGSVNRIDASQPSDMASYGVFCLVAPPAIRTALSRFLCLGHSIMDGFGRQMASIANRLRNVSGIVSGFDPHRPL